MIANIVEIITKTPIYPHWLEFYKQREGDLRMYKLLKGKILEVGAGTGERKQFILSTNSKIKEYIATDYSSWDGEFHKNDKKIKTMGKIAEALYKINKRDTLDAVCSATKLPFKKDTFDWHLSFEVLEHIDDPSKYFKEATRVIKKGGRIGFSVPFLYRIHGGEPLHQMDFHRYAPGFFYKIAKDNNLKVEELYCNTGIGTTMALLINQFLIRNFVEGNILKKLITLPTLLLFPVVNVVGLFLDLKPDTRFTTRFHVIFKKI